MVLIQLQFHMGVAYATTQLHPGAKPPSSLHTPCMNVADPTAELQRKTSKEKLKTQEQRNKHIPCLVQRTNALEIIFHLHFSISTSWELTAMSQFQKLLCAAYLVQEGCGIWNPPVSHTKEAPEIKENFDAQLQHKGKKNQIEPALQKQQQSHCFQPRVQALLL